MRNYNISPFIDYMGRPSYHVNTSLPIFCFGDNGTNLEIHNYYCLRINNFLEPVLFYTIFIVENL